MVLRNSIHLTQLIIFALLIGACSMQPQRHRPPVIPVNNESPTGQEDTIKAPKQLSIIKEPAPTRPLVELDSEQADKKDDVRKEAIENERSVRNQSTTNILSVLLGKANKATEAQQWLRAQRVLEQALRIDPQNPLIFARYGDLYIKMGAEEKANNMYQRALYLATEGSDLKKEIEMKVNSLD